MSKIISKFTLFFQRHKPRRYITHKLALIVKAFILCNFWVPCVVFKKAHKLAKMEAYKTTQIYGEKTLSTLHGMYRHAYPIILEWDSKQNRYFTKGSHRPRYFLWKLVTYFMIGFSVFLSYIVMILNESYEKPKVVAFSVVAPWCMCAIGFASITQSCLEDVIQAFVGMKRIFLEAGLCN